MGSASRIILTGCSGPKAQSRSVARRSFAERVKCVLGTWCGDGLGLVVGCWVVLGLGSLRVGWDGVWLGARVIFGMKGLGSGRGRRRGMNEKRDEEE